MIDIQGGRAHLECSKYIPQKDRNVLDYGIASFGFLINNKGSMSFKTFSDNIKKVYDVKTNEQIQDVCVLLERYSD